MIHYIAEHPEQQERLRHEVSVLGEHLDDSEDALPAPDVVQSLDYLQAVIKESLRMRPNSTPLPRITPHDRTVSIAGVDGIPPRTRVNCFQWLLHRNPDVWEQPDSWAPERWLDADGKERRDMPPLWAFVTGPRACIGTQLTYYREFRDQLPYHIPRHPRVALLKFALHTSLQLHALCDVLQLQFRGGSSGNLRSPYPWQFGG